MTDESIELIYYLLRDGIPFPPVEETRIPSGAKEEEAVAPKISSSEVRKTTSTMAYDEDSSGKNLKRMKRCHLMKKSLSLKVVYDVLLQEAKEQETLGRRI